MSTRQTRLLLLCLIVTFVGFLLPVTNVAFTRLSLFELIMGAFSGGVWSVARVLLASAFVANGLGIAWCAWLITQRSDRSPAGGAV